MSNEGELAEVSKTKQAGEAESGWNWVEREAWTERMLQALVTGVKGFPRAGAVLLIRSPRLGNAILSKVKPPTGEPGPGKPDAGFGGRGDGFTTARPYP